MNRIIIILSLILFLSPSAALCDDSKLNDKDPVLIIEPTVGADSIPANGIQKSADPMREQAEPEPVRRGCCSWHGGVCGCDESHDRIVCCDGTLSPSCTCSGY